MTDKIRECPFCGGEAMLRKRGRNTQNYVVCENCGAVSKITETEADAIEAWNNRTTMDRIVEEVNEIGRRVCNNVKCNRECDEDSERICDHGVLMGAVIDAIVKGVQNGK